MSHAYRAPWNDASCAADAIPGATLNDLRPIARRMMRLAGFRVFGGDEWRPDIACHRSRCTMRTLQWCMRRTKRFSPDVGTNSIKRRSVAAVHDGTRMARWGRGTFASFAPPGVPDGEGRRRLSADGAWRVSLCSRPMAPSARTHRPLRWSRLCFGGDEPISYVTDHGTMRTLFAWRHVEACAARGQRLYHVTGV